jgi:hypothetical protein
MWLFNVTRAILHQAGRIVLPESVPKDEQLAFDLARREAWADNNSRRVWVLKVHGVILRTDLPLSKIITCIRDPRDVLVSFRTFMDTTFEHALATSAGVKRYAEMYREYPQDLLLSVRYDEIETRPAQVVRRVAGFLGVPLLPADEVEIAERFSRERVRQLADNVTQSVLNRLGSGAGVSAEEVVLHGQTLKRAFDPSTGFQTGHVSGNRSGDWRRLLSNEEKRQVRETFGDWFERNGYPAE